MLPTVRIHSLSIGGDPKIGRVLSLHPATSASKRGYSSVLVHLPSPRASHLASRTALVAPARLRPRRNCLVAHRRRSFGSIGPANEACCKRGMRNPSPLPGDADPPLQHGSKRGAWPRTSTHVRVAAEDVTWLARAAKGREDEMMDLW